MLSFDMNTTMPDARRRFIVAMDNSFDPAFFWGYLIAQLPGGLLAAVLPANKIFGAAIAFSAFLNVIFPIFFEITATARIVIIIRLLQGLVEVIVEFVSSKAESRDFLQR